MELLTLAIFAMIALWKVATMDISGEITPSLEWFNPFSLSSSALAAGVILGIFIYWGWDSTVSVNEESADPTEGPGKAAVVSTVVLLGIYVLVAVAAQAYHGVGFLKANSDDVLSSLGTDVLGSPWDKLLIIAVLTSASASCQTTILPATRSALSMAAKRAAPKRSARSTRSFLTPSTATIWMGVISVAWYVGLKLISDNVLYDAVAGARHDDRLLLRHHRHRVPDLLPPRAAKTVRAVSCSRACRRDRRDHPVLGALQVGQPTASTRTPTTPIRGLARPLRAVGRHRRRLLHPRVPADAGDVDGRQDVLPAQARSRAAGFLDRVAPEPLPDSVQI